MDAIAFSGRMGCGKSSVSKQLIPYGYTVGSLGATMKKTATLLIEDRVAMVQYLETMLGREKGHAMYEALFELWKVGFTEAVWEKGTDGQYVKNRWYRDLLQQVAMVPRQKWGEEIWAEILLPEALTTIKEGKKFVCDDLRVPGEKAVFEQAGFKILRLDISEEEQLKRLASAGYGQPTYEQLHHYSEIALDDATFDFRLDTTELGPDEVFQHVIQFLRIGETK